MSYDKELIFAQELAHEAGKIMRHYFRAKDIGTVWKEDNTPLTVADTDINNLVIERVKAAFPTYAVIGEETSFEIEGDFVWVLDPIDGTIPFSIGMPLSTFSLALVDRNDGQPILGVIYDPYLNHLYTTKKGEGAFLNSKPIRTSQVTDFYRTYISVLGGSEQGEKSYFKQGACVDIIRDQGAKCLSLLSQIYAASRVASGELAGSIFGYGSPWDSAAVSLLVEEAGGVVTDVYGKPRRYDEFAAGCILAPNKTMLSKLVEAVQNSTP
jgi:fructose-1,6-bisphosphatase/inositol monophosphatase family enzyme